MTLAELEADLEDNEALLLEPRAQFDPALLGVLDAPCVAVYSAPRVLQILQRDNGWDHETAREWFDFNVAGARGEAFPVFVWPLEPPPAA